MCGLIAYAHYSDCDPLKAGDISRPDQVTQVLLYSVAVTHSKREKMSVMNLNKYFDQLNCIERYFCHVSKRFLRVNHIPSLIKLWQ